MEHRYGEYRDGSSADRQTSVTCSGMEEKMRNKVRKLTLLTGILCVMSLSVCACGEKEAPALEEQQTNTAEPDPEDSASTPEPSADAGRNDAAQETDADKADTAADGSQEDKDNTQGAEADGSQKEQASTEGVPGTWEDTTPDLEGDVKEMQDGQLTVTEAILDKTDDGAGVIVSAAPGADDSDFNKVTVSYDEKTLFAIQTIYDGGARFEMNEATAADLEKGQSVKVWGDSSGDGLKASQICIVKVV